MRARMLATLVRQTVFAGRFRLAIVALLSIGLWLALYWLFYEGFEFLRHSIPSPDLHDQTVRKVFGMFFVTLMVMLVFSSAIILYSSLFKAPDVAFLLTLPARAERVFLNKFQEAMLMSSWAFVLLGSPMLLAYGIVAHAPWHYFAMLVPFLIAFVYIPAGVGALACLVIVRHLPRRTSHVLATAGIVAIAAGAYLISSLIRGTQGNLLTVGWFEEMLDRLWIAENRLLPSWWLSTGLLEATLHESQQLADSVMFLVLLVSNALFFRQLTVWCAAAMYRPAYCILHGRHLGNKRAQTARIDRILMQIARVLPRQARMLIVKDFRLFRRDPVQWSQFLIFVGLLVLYFLNIRSFNYDVNYAGWVNVVSFLNLAVVGLLLSTFTTRFIFPMVSLEGRRFWVLGLLPLQRSTILWSKFAFAIGGSLVPASLLVLLSDLMLQVEPMVVVYHQLICVILCFGLSGIAVGLGAKMPLFREQSPARIAAGFGGTLSLVLSTLFILAVVALMAVPTHFYFGGPQAAGSEIFRLTASMQRWIRLWLIAGTVASVALGIIATAAPLLLGFRAFRRAEF